MRRMTPNLIVEAIEQCLPFWCETLGFNVSVKVPGPDGKTLGFAILHHGEIELMLQSAASLREDLPDAAQERYHTALFVEVEDLDEVRKKITESGRELLIEPRETFYGTREIGVRDPAGNFVLLAQTIVKEHEEAASKIDGSKSSDQPSNKDAPDDDGKIAGADSAPDTSADDPGDAEGEPAPAPSEPVEADGPLRIESVTPRHGPLLGGDLCRLAGAFEGDELRVRFGDLEAAIDSSSETEISVRVPFRDTPGFVDIVVESKEHRTKLVHGFHYDRPPEVVALEPARVATKKPRRVILRGSFPDGCIVMLGGQRIETTRREAKWVEIQPPERIAGPIDIVVEGSDGQRSALATLTYCEAPEIERIEPAEGPLDGGTEITIIGRNFPRDCQLTFIDRAPPFEWVSEQQIRLKTPARDKPGMGPVVIHAFDGIEGRLDDAFNYWPSPPPEVRAVEPQVAFTTGGARLRITGEHFRDGLRVWLGENEGTVLNVSATLIEVDAPAAEEAGPADVLIENADGQRGVLSNGLVYDAPALVPKLIRIEPATGTTGGGDTIRIVGDNLGPDTVVRLGEVRLVVDSAARTQLVARIPPRDGAGPVAIELTNGRGPTVRVEDAFRYEDTPAPVISDITPKRGLAGDKLVIEGGHFGNSCHVRVGREAALRVVVKENRLEAIVPPTRAPGLVDIEVIRADGAKALSENAFKYTSLPAPIIEGIAPKAGNPTGGTELSVEGKNFVKGTQIVVDGVVCKNQRFVDETTVEARTPPGKDGQMVDVVVRNPDGKEATVRRGFMYDRRYE